MNYDHWKNIEINAWQGHCGYHDVITIEQLYQMFAQRLACEAAERTLDMLKAGL